MSTHADLAWLGTETALALAIAAHGKTLPIPLDRGGAAYAFRLTARTRKPTHEDNANLTHLRNTGALTVEDWTP